MTYKTMIVLAAVIAGAAGIRCEADQDSSVAPSWNGSQPATTAPAGASVTEGLRGPMTDAGNADSSLRGPYENQPAASPPPSYINPGPPVKKHKGGGHSVVGATVGVPDRTMKTGLGMTDRSAKTGVGLTDRSAKVGVGLTDRAIKTSIGLPYKATKEFLKALF